MHSKRNLNSVFDAIYFEPTVVANTRKPIIAAPRKRQNIKFCEKHNKNKKLVPQLVKPENFIYKTPIRSNRKININFSDFSDFSNFELPKLNKDKTPDEYK